MSVGIWILIVLLALIVTAAYACCVVAGEADERAERMYRKWKEREKE